LLNPVILRVATALLLAALTQTTEAKTHQVLKSRVRFLATSTEVRGTWGYNQDIYLAELAPSSGGHTLVRLIDEYFNATPPQSRTILTSPSGAMFRLLRDPQCDLSLKEMQLRAAPGDPMAILPIRLSYRPRLDETPESGAILPCYRTVRR
jgi:hypothetical protein